jgi:hypothetical protein
MIKGINTVDDSLRRPYIWISVEELQTLIDNIKAVSAVTAISRVSICSISSCSVQIHLHENFLTRYVSQEIQKKKIWIFCKWNALDPLWAFLQAVTVSHRVAQSCTPLVSRFQKTIQLLQVQRVITCSGWMYWCMGWMSCCVQTLNLLLHPYCTLWIVHRSIMCK